MLKFHCGVNIKTGSKKIARIHTHIHTYTNNLSGILQSESCGNSLSIVSYRHTFSAAIDILVNSHPILSAAVIALVWLCGSYRPCLVVLQLQSQPSTTRHPDILSRLFYTCCSKGICRTLDCISI